MTREKKVSTLIQYLKQENQGYAVFRIQSMRENKGVFFEAHECPLSGTCISRI